MNFDMFAGMQNDDMDPNYIYPRPYIDPMMYMNPYNTNNMDPNMSMGGYMVYMNPYMSNPMMGQMPLEEDDHFGYTETEDEPVMNNQKMMPGMQGMPPGMMHMMQGMPPGMMFPPGMMQGMPPGMMMPMMPGMMFPPGMMPMMMPGMQGMHPGMMQGMMPQFNMEEFDEEEM